MDNKYIVSFEEILKYLNRVLKAKGQTSFSHVFLDHDYYWDISCRLKYDNFEDVNDFEVKQLSLDLNKLREINYGNVQICASDLRSVAAILEYMGSLAIPSFCNEVSDFLEGEPIDKTRIVELEEVISAYQKIIAKLADDGITEYELKHDYYWHVHRDEKYENFQTPAEVTLDQLTCDIEHLRDLHKPDSDPIDYDLVYIAAILEYFSKMYLEKC